MTRQIQPRGCVEVSNNNGKATDELICASDNSRKHKVTGNKILRLDRTGTRTVNNRDMDDRTRIIPIPIANEYYHNFYFSSSS